MSAETTDRFNSFAEFYPYYLQEHSNDVCRRLHYVGSLLVLSILGYALFSQQWLWLLRFRWRVTALPGSAISCSRRTSRPPSSICCTASWATG